MVKVGDWVLHDRKYIHLKTGKVVGHFVDTVKIKTRDGDIFSCLSSVVKFISKIESRNRDALQKLRK